MKNQLGQEINYVNDNSGQATQVTTPTGEVTQFSYDGQGSLRTVTDNAGNVATYIQDGSGNVTSVEIKENGTTPVYKNTFEYDQYGNMVKEIAKPNLSQPSSDKTTEYLYDESGRLTGKVNPGDSLSNPSVSLGYEYFGLDFLKILNGPKYTFDYNLEGQLTKEELFNSSDSKIGEFSSTYDGMGRQVTFTEKDGSGTEISRIEKPTKDSVKIDMYDQTDNLNGFDLIYKGQSSNPMTYLFDYLKNGLIKTITAAGKQFQVFFDESGRFSSLINPNNTGDELKYNDAGQVIESKTNSVTKAANGTEITTRVAAKWSSQYEYDADGRITAITGQGVGSPNATYAYNNGTEELNRLTQAQISYGGDNYTFDYAYDSRGNILNMDILTGGSVQNQSFTYNDDNQITNSGFVYDNSGNLTRAVIKGATYNYVYDKANRLTEVKDGSNQTIATYTYDSQGQRLTKTTGGSTITYHYVNGGVLYETKSGDANNILHALYINSPQGKPLAVSMNYNISNPGANTWYYYHYNAHGDVIAVTDGNGNVFREYVYDPYGNILSVKDGSGNAVNISSDANFNHAYTYAGYRFDKETGLYYLNARYYEAGIGRFLTKDIELGNQSNIQTLNQYAYCGGDPVNRVDPSGQWLLDAIFLAIDIAVFIANPTPANAAWIALDIACFADPTGIATTVAHAGRAVKAAARAVHAVSEISHVASKVDKAINVTKGAGGAKTTLDYLKDVQKINGNYYAPGNTLNEMGQIEARGVDQYEIVDELIEKVDINAIFSSDDFVISDCFYAIKHLTEDKYETSINELKYFLECFEGLREYNLEEKNNIINQNNA